ncbi:MAG TPA: phage tail protein [Candidatus Sulfotelmatobacter sp.]|nr:phage tail protein [Candidatus Sulfotelmatobacter sp.]
MKRAPFLLGSGAALLAGCGGGGHSVMRAIPGLDAPAAVAHKSNAKLQLVPVTPDPIPADVLANPIVGEARRFNGSVAPRGWMFAQGQALQSDLYAGLAQLLGRSNGTAKATFALPLAAFPLIIAVEGARPTSPATLAAVRRPSTVAAAGLGPDARPAPPRLPTPPTAEELAARQLARTAVHVTGATPAELSGADRTRFAAATSDARTAALGALSPATRAQVDGAIDAAAAGRTDLHGAVTATAAALTDDEVAALNGANAGYLRPFSGGWSPNAAEARLAAAGFLVSVAITPQQAQAIAARE